MDRRTFLTAVAGGAVVGTAGCGGRDPETPVKVANRREGQVSFRLLVGRLGAESIACADGSATPTPVAETTLDGGETAIITRLSEAGTYRLQLELGDATHENCTNHEGTEREFVYVIETDVRFVRNDPGVGFPAIG